MSSSLGKNSLTQVTFGSKNFQIYSLQSLAKEFPNQLHRLPFSLLILLENLLRFDDGGKESAAALDALIHWQPQATPHHEIAFMPARVIMQDFTGVPAIVDLAAMREAMKQLGGDPDKINPQLPVDLVIDHSVQVDAFANSQAYRINVEKEYERNRERYAFLRWGQQTFSNLRVVPPGTGIVHQVNLEYLASVIFTGKLNQQLCLYPDTVVGTDSHTTMINGLGVLGWGVGGIEAEAAMLGQPISLLIPQVVGFELTGRLPAGATATDMVLTVTQMLRAKGVVDKFVEFYGTGIRELSLADRATISNMSPEYGATCGLFPIDQETLNYLKLTGRSRDQIALVESYAKHQGLFTEDGTARQYSDTLSLNLAHVEPSLAGPKRPQDRFALKNAKPEFAKSLDSLQKGRPSAKTAAPAAVLMPRENQESPGSDTSTQLFFKLNHGAVVIAAITSCTNTSNPEVMVAAGLMAKKACERGLKRARWVKSSLAPGSKVVTDYLKEAGLLEYLEELGFHVVGYGCTTCIGNSGPLPEPIAKAVQDADLVVCAVLSGNRNFDGRINPHVRASYLASPPLVVAYALTGRMDIDITQEPVGLDRFGDKVYLKDIWPTPKEVQEVMEASVKTKMFTKQYGQVFDGDDLWKKLPTPKSKLYKWDKESTYIKLPPFFERMTKETQPLKPIRGMKVLAMVGDSITTDHISPAGSIAQGSEAALYLTTHGIAPADFNSYGSRRGNFEVMVRGTFANIRLRNLLVPNSEGGVAVHPSSHEPVSIFAASTGYATSRTPLMVIAGKEYGSGSSRDWAAKGPNLLGVRVVLAESFERIHRSNLIGMGILPVVFALNTNLATLGLNGQETYDLEDLGDTLNPGAELTMKATGSNQQEMRFPVRVCINTMNEISYLKHGGILQFVLRNLIG